MLDLLKTSSVRSSTCTRVLWQLTLINDNLLPREIKPAKSLEKVSRLLRENLLNSYCKSETDVESIRPWKNLLL